MSMKTNEVENADSERIIYSYDDMLAAWVAGRHTQRVAGDDNESDSPSNAPDFSTWIKNYTARQTN